MIALRQFEASDIPLLVEFLNDSKVTQYVTEAIAQPYSIDDAQWWVTHSHDSAHIKAITYQGKFVGCISATVGLFEYSRSAQLGYWIGQAYWNKGIATHAVKEFSTALIHTTDIKRLFVCVVSLNLASVRVLEKNNFSLEGTLKQASCKHGEFFDEHILAKTFS